MKAKTRRSVLAVLTASLITALLTGGLLTAGAQDAPESRVTINGFYVKGKVFKCAAATCAQPKVVAKCSAGDAATGGSAHVVESGGFTYGFTGRAWGGTATKAARGWQADPQGAGPDFFSNGDKLVVKAVCADLP